MGIACLTHPQQLGFVVKLGRSVVIHHFESPKRDFTCMDLYGRLNNILLAWHNIPATILPLYLPATTINGIRHGIRSRRLATMLKGLMMGYRDIPGEWKERRPVSGPTFSLYRELIENSVLPLETVSLKISSGITDPTPGL